MSGHVTGSIVGVNAFENPVVAQFEFAIRSDKIYTLLVSSPKERTMLFSRIMLAVFCCAASAVSGQTATNFLADTQSNFSSSGPKGRFASTYIGSLALGSTSVTQQDGGVVSAGGTVVVGAALSDGLILAADSRQTVMFPLGVQPSYKVVSDSANKLFSVGRVGISTFGEAFILGRSIESFVVEYGPTAPKNSDINDIAKSFSQYFGKYYDKQVAEQKTLPQLGFILAGYDKGGIGRLIEIRFPANREPTVLSQNTHENQGLVFQGQTDVIRRLVMGFDPSLGASPTLQKLSDDDKEQLKKELGNLEYYIPFNYLPLQDGIDITLSLVQATVDMQRFSFGTRAHPGDIPGVGGSVDVLTITPSDIFWVRKKQLSASSK